MCDFGSLKTHVCSHPGKLEFPPPTLAERDERMHRVLFHGTAACHNGKLVDKYANFEAAGDFMSGTEVGFSHFNECNGSVFLLFYPFWRW